MIGDSGASVPDIAVDLGVADIFISDQAQTIRYTGKGLKTDVGVGVPGPARGMTVEGGEGINRPAMTDYRPPHSVSRPAIAKTEEPVRGTTSVSGINRPKIADDTRKMVEGTYEEPEPVKDIEAEYIDKTEPKPELSEYLDEDPNWLREPEIEDVLSRFDETSKKKKPANRVNTGRTRSQRGRNDSPTMIRGLRL